MTTLLSTEKLSTSFYTRSKKIRAVQQVSFNLKEGEVLGIIGESGSGKSAMAKSITQLLPKRSSIIESGTIIYKGEDLLKKTKKEMRAIRGKEISMIFQDPMTSLNPTMKIGKQVGEGYRLHHPQKSKLEVYRHVIQLLIQVGIPQPEERYHQYPHELSGGMRQRVMIAIAISCNPSILLADEPTTALDVTIQSQILKLLKKIQQDKNMSIILITHDFSIVANFCDRILVMYAGKVIEEAPVIELFESPKHPYTKELLNAVPRLDLENQNKLNAIEGLPPDLSISSLGCAFEPRCSSKMTCCKNTPPSFVKTTANHLVKCHLFSKDPTYE